MLKKNAFPDGTHVSKVLPDKTLTVVSQLWCTCSVMSAWFTKECELFFFSALTSGIVATEYLMQLSDLVLNGIICDTMLVLAFINL